VEIQDESGLDAGKMEHYWQVGLKQREVFICSEYGNIVAYSYSTDKKVSI